MKHTYESLCHSRLSDLEGIFRAGHRPRAEDLEGWEFRGFNTPFFTRILGFQKFKKAFYRTRDTAPGTLDGYNVRTKQNGFADPWIDGVRKGEPFRHGFYVVVPPGGKDGLYPSSLLIDYSLGKNPFYDPTQFLRDYLTQPDPENADLFLGKAYVALGPRRVPVSFFVLERSNPSPLQAARAAA